MAFVPGKSGNPGGRPKENAEVKALARSHCKVAVEKLAALMDSADEKTSLAACNSILDRGLGKPAQALIGGDEEDPSIKVDVLAIKLVKASGGA
jgi:hypothetical protein